jgi:spore germination protein YaaH
MKTIRILSIIGLIIGILLVVPSSILFFTNRNKSENDDLIIEEIEEEPYEEKEDTEEVEGEEEIVLKESGWIPNWAFDLGFESLKNNYGIIDTVTPVLYSVDKSGNVISRGVSDVKINNLLEYCKENNIRVIPTVGSYDFESMKSALSSQESYTKNINTIVTEIEKYGFDGIDLDYEMISTTEKENYILFLKSLKTELSKRNKVLSVTVFAQWENATYQDHPETRLVQNYEEIGGTADEVRIMAYDYTYHYQKSPAPVGPINWIRDVLDYATKYIPKEKIWLGVHLYAYQWTSGKIVALTYTSVSSVLSNPSILEIFKEDIGEGYAEYGCDGGQCIIYYQNNQGVQMRRDIAKEYGIAGVTYWRLGGELDILK